VSVERHLLIKLGKLVKFGAVMNCGKFHFDRTFGFGSSGCPFIAGYVGKRSRLHCNALTTVHSVITKFSS
jgi:hypothetical protein